MSELQSSTPVLIIDDQPSNCELLSQALETEGYSSVTAYGGEEALRLLEERPFRAVILDLMMPRVSGLDVLRRVREKFSMVDLPILVATARTQGDDMVQAFDLGANDYITKPLDLRAVLARLRVQLSVRDATQEIRRLAEELERRNRFIQRTFGRYLSDEVVERLLDTPDGLHLGGEKRTVTIVFSDLRGFSSLAETLGPDQVVRLLNNYLGAMTDVIARYQGTIDEFIGDAVMVVFGAPILRQDDAVRAVRCAMAMQQAIVQVNAENARDGLPAVEMAVAVHTGEAIVGNIGSPKRAKYGVVGNAVNIAARIQAIAVGGQVLISEETQRQAGPGLLLGPRFRFEPKGLLPLDVHEVQGLDGVPTVLASDREDLVPLQPPLVVSCERLEDKRIVGPPFAAELVARSARRGRLRTTYPVPIFTDLRIRIGSEPKDLFVKVLPGSDAVDGLLIHFSAEALGPTADALASR